MSIAVQLPGVTTDLTCTANPILTSGGVGTFSGCRIDRAGTYTLTASSGVLTSGVSGAFVVS